MDFLSVMDTFLEGKQQIFDRWAPNYDWLVTSIYYQAVHKRLLSYVSLPEQPTVLDLGCGTGKLLDRLGDRFPTLKGFGVDLSPQMLRQARATNRHHPRLIFTLGNAEALPCADQQFDAVFNTISFLHYRQPEQVFAEVSRVLRPSGQFYLVDSAFWGTADSQTVNISPGGVRFYKPAARERLGTEAGLFCQGHHYLLGPVLLSIFTKR